MTYKNSDLYKDIVSNNRNKKKPEIAYVTEKKNKKKNKKNKEVDNIFISINKCDYIELKQDVIEMKNEITELKNTIKELVVMMKAVYEFEDA